MQRTCNNYSRVKLCVGSPYFILCAPELRIFSHVLHISFLLCAATVLIVLYIFIEDATVRTIQLLLY